MFPIAFYSVSYQHLKRLLILFVTANIIVFVISAGEIV